MKKPLTFNGGGRSKLFGENGVVAHSSRFKLCHTRRASSQNSNTQSVQIDWVVAFKLHTFNCSRIFKKARNVLRKCESPVSADTFGAFEWAGGGPGRSVRAPGSFQGTKSSWSVIRLTRPHVASKMQHEAYVRGKGAEKHGKGDTQPTWAVRA